jgi:hypothetical protein
MPQRHDFFSRQVFAVRAVQNLVLGADPEQGFIVGQMLYRAQFGEQADDIPPFEVMGNRMGKQGVESLPVGFRKCRPLAGRLGAITRNGSRFHKCDPSLEDPMCANSVIEGSFGNYAGRVGSREKKEVLF